MKRLAALGICAFSISFLTKCEYPSLITYEDTFTLPSYGFAGKMYVNFLRTGHFSYDLILLGLEQGFSVQAYLTADSPIYVFKEDRKTATKHDTVSLNEYAKRFDDKYEVRIIYITATQNGRVLLYDDNVLIFSRYVPVGREPEGITN